MSFRLHRRVAGLFGYELIKKRKLNDTLEQHIRNVLDISGINVIVDVGANEGQFALACRADGFAGRIVSFEPLQEAFNELKVHCDNDVNWHAYRLALGSVPTHCTMNKCSSSDFSSLLSPNQYASSRFGWRADVASREEVQVTTLVQLWSAIVTDIAKPRVMLKLDTQGYDLQVLAGAVGVLHDVQALQIELSLKSIYDGAPRYLETLARLEKLGFEVTGLYPISRDKQTLAVIEYDCVLTRSPPQDVQTRSA
jgi:FkbM family methyltransferase